MEDIRCPLVGARAGATTSQAFDANILAWLALNRLTDCGSVSQHRLLRSCGGMKGLLQAPADILSAWLKPASLKSWLAFRDAAATSALRVLAEQDFDRAMELGVSIVHAGSLDYPALLAEIHSAPTVLYVKGNVHALHLPQLAIVGSRSASEGGFALAREFSARLGQSGLTITSGLALGIDGAAHQGALQVGASTVAVVATGLDEVYPRRHIRLADEILAEGGAIVSEMPPYTPPHASNFPRRNRIISGLSLGTLVIEAGLQSGSLITARFAMEQGREVFALPGSVRSAFHRGCHALIRQGATLVESASDIVEQLGGLLAFKQEECRVLQEKNPDAAVWTEEAIRVFRRVDHTPVGMDELAARCMLPVELLSSALLELELLGVITRENGFFCRC